jgi:hypothetical protein
MAIHYTWVGSWSAGHKMQSIEKQTRPNGKTVKRHVVIVSFYARCDKWLFLEPTEHW